MILDKLHKASFRNIEFLVSTESVDRGRKVVYHEYPNSDVRYVEELGKIPPLFTIDAIVHGSDAINRRLQLENALEQPGLGKLEHPVYGVIQVKVADFSVNFSQANIGQFSFAIKFAQSRENVTAEPAAPTETEVASKAQDARDAVNDALEFRYKPPRDTFNFNSAIETLQAAFNEVNDRIRYVTDLSSDGAAAFNDVYRTVTNNITRIVASAQTIRQNVSSFYLAALDAAVYTDQLSAAWRNLLDYPLIVATSSPITRLQSEQQQNDISINEHLKITALINAYEAYAYTDFTTDTELTAARQLLDDSYKEQFNGTDKDISDIGLESIAGDNSVRNALSELIIAARKVFDDKEKTIFRVVQIKPGLTSMPLATYRYYGSLNNLDALIGLNESVNQANFNTIIDAITS